MIKRLLVPLLAASICAALAVLCIRPAVTARAGDVGADIRLTATMLNPDQPHAARTRRVVAPGLERIAPWISAVGASVAAADFNADGIQDEACLVDPRDDSVAIFAIPGSSSRQHRVELVAQQPSTTPTAPMGCVPADLNEDGLLDAVVYYWGRSPVIFYGSTEHTFAPVELVTPAQVWNSTTLNVADVDGNGHLDLLVGNYFPDRARVLDPDAKDDRFMQMQDSMSRARNAGHNRIFLSDKRRDRPTFVDASTAFPADSSNSWTLSFGAQDLTGDLLPDLYVANDFGPDQLLINNSTPGTVRFNELVQRRDAVTAKSSVLGRDSFKGMGVVFPHIGNEPQPSIMVSNITEPYALQESNFVYRPEDDAAQALRQGTVPYAQRSEALNLSRSGWSWDLKAADLDGDGHEEIAQATGFVSGNTNGWPELQELAMANDWFLHIPAAWLKIDADTDLSGSDPNRLWCFQPAVEEFRDCAPLAGVADRRSTRAYAVTDFNQDAKPDLLAANQWAPSTAYTNSTRTPNSFIWVQPMIRSDSTGKLRAAIGSTIRLSAPGIDQHRQLYPANGHTGTSASTVPFGIGTGHNSAQATIAWRDDNGDRHRQTVTVRPGHNTVILNSSGEADRR